MGAKSTHIAPRQASRAKDKELMLEVVRGDHRAFEEIYQRYSPLVTWFLDQCGDEAVSTEDLTQEVFARIWARRQSFWARANVKSYILAYARRVRAEHHHRRVKERTIGGRVPGSSAASEVELTQPPTEVEQAECLERLRQAIHALPSHQQEAVILHCLEQLPLREACKMAHCTQKCLESRLLRAVRNLRFLLADLR